jgi:hypothetical protein
MSSHYDTPRSARPRAGSASSPRGRTGSLSSSIGSFILSLSGDENSDESDEFIVAPVFEQFQDRTFQETDDIENSPHHIHTSTNAFYENLVPDDVAVSEQQEEPL